MPFDYASVVFAYDMNTIVASGGNRYLKDFGASSFDFRFPGGAADPTPDLSGGLVFDGGDHLYYDGDLARFYAQMPTGAATLLYATTLTDSAVRTIFSCQSFGANNRGMLFGSQTAAIYGWYQWQNAATNPVIQPTGHAATRQHLCALTMEATPRFIRDGSQGTATWAAGAFGTCVYDPAIVPRIGSVPVGGQFWLGSMRYLCLLRGALHNDDLAYASRLMAEGVKPFCYRRAA